MTPRDNREPDGTDYDEAMNAAACAGHLHCMAACRAKSALDFRGSMQYANMKGHTKCLEWLELAISIHRDSMRMRQLEKKAEPRQTFTLLPQPPRKKAKK